MNRERRERNRGRGGFTLVEAVLSTALIGLVAAALFGVYASGLQAMEETIHRAQAESAARSRMEKLLAYKFDRLGGGEETIVIGDDSYVVRWWSGVTDLNGDHWPDYDARMVYVQCEDVFLTTLLFDGIDHRIKI